MNSSGIKRGLAVSAISALAVTALPVLAGQAHAQPLAEELAAGAVELYTQDVPFASTQNDGTNTTVHLLAGGGEDVRQVRFTYSVAGGAEQTIATVSRQNGAFSTEWTPPANVLGALVTITATGLDAAGTLVVGATDGSGPVIAGAGSTAVDIANAAGSAIGAFQQPYAAANNKLLAVVSGTTSGDAPSLDARSVPTPGAAREADVVSEPANGIRTWSGSVDLTSYVFDAPAPGNSAVDQVVVGAVEGSDDAEALTVYKQTITTVTATATRTQVPTGGTADVTVSVLDQLGKAIAGARVSDGTDTVFTNSKGEALFEDVAAGTTNYHVDTTATEGYQAADDFQRSVTITAYNPVLTSLASSSKDGAAFDRDEYAAGDLKVTAKDQNGNDILPLPAGTRGVWTLTTFGATPTTSTQNADIDLATGNVALPTGADGTYRLNTWVERDGTPGETAGDLSAAPLTVKIGEAEIVWDDANNVVQAQPASTSTQKGFVQLADGTRLAARAARVVLTPGAGGDARLAATQPAGTTRASDTVANVVTGNDGSFSVAVQDPAVPATTPPTAQPSETATLDADSTSLDIALADTDDLRIDFVDLAVKTVEFSAIDYTIDGQATPGRPVSYTVTVKNAAGELLKDAPVQLSLDRGFFTTYSGDEAGLVPASTPTADAPYGVWKNEGTTKTLTTDADGTVDVTIAIERDAEFDDDGIAPVELTAVAGGVTSKKVTEFESTDALNVASVSLEFAPDGQDSRALPKAQTGTDVLVDVFAKDQFGNLTETAVSVTDGSSPATTTPANGNVTSNFTDEAPAITATSAQDVVQKLEALANDTTVTKYVDGNPVLPGFQAAKNETTTVDRTDDLTIEWYDVDLAQSSFELTDNGDAFNPVGSTVIVTYTALDQNGNPIVGETVKFFRSGPDDQQDGDGADNTPTTNENGVARYVFQGTREGTAVITAFLQEANGNVVPDTEAERRIVFGEEPAEIQPIVARLTANNNGGKPDRLIVTTGPAADGATVRLFRIKRNGDRVRVGQSTLNDQGRKVFRVADRNGRKFTRYVAAVRPTADTLGDQTNRKRVR